MQRWPAVGLRGTTRWLQICTTQWRSWLPNPSPRCPALRLLLHCQNIKATCDLCSLHRSFQVKNSIYETKKAWSWQHLYISGQFKQKKKQSIWSIILQRKSSMSSLHRHRSKRRSDLLGELDDIYFRDAEHNNSNQFLLPRVARENVFKLRESLVPRLGEEAKSKSSSKESSQCLEPSKIYKNYTTLNDQMEMVTVEDMILPAANRSRPCQQQRQRRKIFWAGQTPRCTWGRFLKQIVACNASTVTLILLFTRGYNQWHLPQYYLADPAALGLSCKQTYFYCHCVGFKAFQNKLQPRKTDGGQNLYHLTIKSLL